jgi:endonuclease/exonuclease/phosphatase family metal-dependent hydrolase
LPPAAALWQRATMTRFRFAVWLLWFALPLYARPFMVVAYNVENLHDVDGVAQFEEYQPAHYTPAHCLTKLLNIERVVAQFENGRGPDVLLLCELEVDFTPTPQPPDYDAILARYAGQTIEQMLGAKFDAAVADLPAEVLLAKTFADHGLTGYHVVVAENITAPGTARTLEQKCAVFTRFPVKAVRLHPTLDARAILEVQLEVDGAPLYVFANHWKSGAGDPAMEQVRVANARTLRARLDEILRADPNADIILGGDFNSHYNQKQRYPDFRTTALNDVLGSQGNELAIRGAQRDLYNLWFELPPAERGSDTYRGEWGTLIQLIISRGLYDFRGVQYVDNSFAVGRFRGLNADDAGVPLRWTFDGPAGGGFSDHFPVSARFTTVTDGRADRYFSLRNASADRGGPAPATKIDYAAVDLEKVALTTERLPAGADLRSNALKGRIIRVEGRVAEGARLAVEFRGTTFDIYTYDAALRRRLRAEYTAGAPIRFYGELGQYNGRWQFVIQDAAWLK